MDTTHPSVMIVDILVTIRSLRMISHIVALSDNNVIGVDGEIPWHLPEDLKRFKRMTSNHVVIMGRKTHEGIGKPLPNRVNIIITRQVGYRSEGCLIAASLEDALKVSEMNDDEIFIIGGGEIYKQSMHLIDTIHMTRVWGEIEGDTKYPDIPSDFKCENIEDLKDFSYITYKRKK